MAEAADPDIARYADLQRLLHARAASPARARSPTPTWLCPVDGAISQFGAIERDRIFQAKGHDYTTTALVGGDAALAARFEDGSFATLYLSPRDYHRIHMPCDGRLRAHDPRARRAVLGQPDDGARRARPVRAQRARGLRVRRRRTGPSCWCWWARRSSAAWPPSGTAWSTRRARAGCANGATRDGAGRRWRTATRWAASCSARRW